MKKYSFNINGNKYNVEILKHEDDIITLDVNGTTYNVKTEKGAPNIVPPKTPTLVRSSASTNMATVSGSPSGTAQFIKAPLPGNILNILVREGDSVTKGQKLLVYEAMKMENDVLAEGNGTVTKIHVKVGDSVLQGAMLIEIK
ncbi:MAG: biotin/lipoyl-binding protein [Bacteroidales bacterium]|nr:biotin/lipoyl-binding protein [Bacteroidales bacterium]